MSGTDRPTILVTGGAGYIGSHTCKALAKSGYRPLAVDNLSLGHRWAVKWGPLEAVDVRDTPSIVALLQRHRPAAVIHFAASAYVGDSLRDPSAYYSNNLVSTLSLLDAMRATGVGRLVFSSTCAVYGDPVDLPVGESHRTIPISPYGQTKLDCENAIRWFANAYGFEAIALRYFNAAGADPGGELGEDHEPETRLVPRAILAALGREPPLEVFGNDYPTPDGTAIRDYVHVTDLADAHVAALEALGGDLNFLPINLGTDSGYSVAQVIRVVQEVLRQEVPHSFAPRRKGDPAVITADCSRARSVLRWEPAHSDLYNIVMTAAAWHRRRTHT